MKKRIKSIKEFENTCIRCERGYTLNEDDMYLFPMDSEKFVKILGRNVEVKQDDSKNMLYWIEEIGSVVPWWYFSEKKRMEIE